MLRGAGWLLVLAGALAGCSGLRTYESTLPSNLNIRARLGSGDALSTSAPLVSTFGADVHVIDVDPRCQRIYRGTVALGGAPARIGIPTGHPTYLVVEFSGRNVLTRGSGSSSYATLLTPRAGYQYDVDIAYDDAMYSVTVHERDPRGGQLREVEHRPFSACIPR